MSILKGVALFMLQPLAVAVGVIAIAVAIVAPSVVLGFVLCSVNPAEFCPNGGF